MAVTKERQAEIYQQLIFARDMIQYIIDGGAIDKQYYPQDYTTYIYQDEHYNRSERDAKSDTVLAICEALETIGAWQGDDRYHGRVTLNLEIISVEEEKAIKRKKIQAEIARMQEILDKLD